MAVQISAAPMQLLVIVSTPTLFVEEFPHQMVVAVEIRGQHKDKQALLVQAAEDLLAVLAAQELVADIDLQVFQNGGLQQKLLNLRALIFQHLKGQVLKEQFQGGGFHPEHLIQLSSWVRPWPKRSRAMIQPSVSRAAFSASPGRWRAHTDPQRNPRSPRW